MALIPGSTTAVQKRNLPQTSLPLDGNKSDNLRFLTDVNPLGSLGPLGTNRDWRQTSRREVSGELQEVVGCPNLKPRFAAVSMQSRFRCAATIGKVLRPLHSFDLFGAVQSTRRCQHHFDTAVHSTLSEQNPDPAEVGPS